MDKIVKKIGNSVGIIFNKEEQDIYSIQINDTLTIEITAHGRTISEN